MFETIADDIGKTKQEIIKDYFGEEGFEKYKTEYSDKFKYLVGMEEE